MTIPRWSLQGIFGPHWSLQGILGGVIVLIALSGVIPRALNLYSDASIPLTIIMLIIGFLLMVNQWWYEPRKRKK